MASTAAAMDLRGLLEFEREDLIKGFMLIGPELRAQVRAALEEAEGAEGEDAT